MKTEFIPTTEQVLAGARVIIKRAARRCGENPKHWPQDALFAWAKSNPKALAFHLEQWFNAAAKCWEDGNNSGNPETLTCKENEMAVKREQAEKVLYLLRVIVDYPGLYPSFNYNGHDYYDLKSVLAEIQ